MSDEKGVAVIAIILLFCFFALLFPEIANTMYASGTTSYARPLMIGMISVLAGAFIFFLYKVIENG